MTQSASNPYDALKLAKKGDPKAIQAVINHLLKDRNITAKVSLKNDAVHIILQSQDVISQALSTASLMKVLQKINAPYINTAIIQAKTQGQVNPVWTECIPLNTQYKPQPEIPQIKEKKSLFSVQWPMLFPYPSSWLRTVILLLWTGIIVRIFGFWGALFAGILSLIADDPILFLQILGISLLGSCLVLSYVYHLIDFNKPSNSPRWFPRPVKLWEGIYAPIVLVLSFIIVILLCFPFVPLNECTLSSASQSSYCRRILNSYFDELEVYATIIWLLSIAYLYQIEYLLRTHFPLKKFLKLIGISLVTIFTITSLQFTLKYWDYISGALTAFITPQITTANQIDTIPVKTEAVTKAPEINKIDPFKKAINKATIAATLTQSAKSKLEWEEVANHWQNALELMKEIPSSHTHYQAAQDRVILYQKNLEYAQLAASQASL
ncbi:MAG: hypothetical protein WBA13_02195 [Microcoleaceae cyanobacterium]